MKRLTIPFIDYTKPGVVDEMRLATLSAAMSKLSIYEDAEEQGRMAVMPCKVGDTIYAPTRNIVSTFRVTQIVFSGADEPSIWVNWKLIDGITGTFRIDGIDARHIGKRVFLTRTEAEKELKSR